MIQKNKITTYLFYAIGEIVLVVLGILIALQVSSWQEDKKKLKTEITILRNIQNDLQSDTSDLNFNLQYHKLFLEHEKKLLSYMQGNDDIDIDSISFEYALGIPLFSIVHEASFSNLQNNDLGTISNNDLKQEVSRHYDFFVRAIQGIENQKGAYETYPLKLPYFLKYFQLDEEVKTLSNEEIRTKQYYNPDFERTAFTLTDPQRLRSDNAFKIVLSESILVRQLKIQFYEDFLRRTKNLDTLIGEELSVLNTNR